MRIVVSLSAALALAAAVAADEKAPRPKDAPAARGVDAKEAPRPVPRTRPEMKQALEDLKGIKPRIPLPAITDEEKAKLGERGNSYEGRLRHHYLPGSEARGGGFSREPDPKMTLDYKFKTQLFWIVSRTNNCYY
jgi:hypothetical protein